MGATGGHCYHFNQCDRAGRGRGVEEREEVEGWRRGRGWREGGGGGERG